MGDAECVDTQGPGEEIRHFSIARGEYQGQSEMPQESGLGRSGKLLREGAIGLGLGQGFCQGTLTLTCMVRPSLECWQLCCGSGHVALPGDIWALEEGMNKRGSRSCCEPGRRLCLRVNQAWRVLSFPLFHFSSQSHKAWRMVLSFSPIQLGQSYLPSARTCSSLLPLRLWFMGITWEPGSNEESQASSLTH